MTQIPRDPTLDSTLSILADGYNYIWKRCRTLHTNIFATRVMGRYTVCIHGHDAAQLFYDESKFQRSGAMPRRVITSLFGQGAIPAWVASDAFRWTSSRLRPGRPNTRAASWVACLSVQHR